MVEPRGIIYPEDHEWIITRLDALKLIETELRQKLVTNYTTTKNEINIEAIQWFLKGGKPATFNDPFAYSFATNKDGSIPQEKASILEYLKKNESYKTGQYIITLSKDQKFLNRKIEVK